MRTKFSIIHNDLAQGLIDIKNTPIINYGRYQLKTNIEDINNIEVFTPTILMYQGH